METHAGFIRHGATQRVQRRQEQPAQGRRLQPSGGRHIDKCSLLSHKANCATGYTRVHGGSIGQPGKSTGASCTCHVPASVRGAHVSAALGLARSTQLTSEAGSGWAEVLLTRSSSDLPYSCRSAMNSTSTGHAQNPGPSAGGMYRPLQTGGPCS